MKKLSVCLVKSFEVMPRHLKFHACRNVICLFARLLSLFARFLGQVELNLNRMPKPAKSARRCSLQQLPSFEEGRSSSSVETVSLFEMKRVYGWWPCVAQEAGEEMQLTVRSKSKFSLKIVAYFYQFYLGEFGGTSKEGDDFFLFKGRASH